MVSETFCRLQSASPMTKFSDIYLRTGVFLGSSSLVSAWMARSRSVTMPRSCPSSTMSTSPILRSRIVAATSLIGVLGAQVASATDITSNAFVIFHLVQVDCCRSAAQQYQHPGDDRQNAQHHAEARD